MSNALIVIPSRLNAQRLPNKPLIMFEGKPMINHVYERAQKADIGEVIVATPDEEIKESVESIGGKAVITDPDHPTGTDRIFEAVETFDKGKKFDIIVNVQGDIVNVDYQTLPGILKPFKEKAVDMTSLAAPIRREEDLTNPNVVKIALEHYEPELARALYFSRNCIPGIKPGSDKKPPYYYHLGIYGYRREALKRFVGLPESTLERTEGLEQLRALAAGMRIDLAFVKDIPISIDVADDVVRARRYFETKQKES